ncbi:MAG: zinc ribbon domain-containing protein [Acidobacteria bacterium]|nr:zinc ribbon domain-containing protein [Acidobacteriota bacterium]
MNSFDSFTLTPMSAGDVIDRAVRIYRRNFLALLRIVFGPSLIAYFGTVMYYLGVRNFSVDRGDKRVVVSLGLIVGGFIIWMVGKAAFYAVLGGASRSLVDHFFEGKTIRAMDVYRVVRERFWSLVGALLVIGLLLMGATAIIYFLAAISLMIGFAGAAILADAPIWLKTIFSIGFVLVIAVSAFMIFLLIYSRVVYVPQVMMVEGKGVFNSISRSFSLAGGELWRIAALLLFWVYVAWSVWVLLFVPLLSLAEWLGFEWSPFRQDIPFWFNITYQTLAQVSEIVIAPIAMLGFTLLYLDSRVRKEGFDIELMANRLLPPTPEMVRQTWQPHSVFFDSPVSVRSTSSVPSILGLNDYTPIRQQAADPVAPVDVAAPEPAADGFPEFIAEDRSVEPEVYMAAATADLLPDPPNESPAVSNHRTCRWCGTEAGDEDRFCRVCGEVF